MVEKKGNAEAAQVQFLLIKLVVIASERMKKLTSRLNKRKTKMPHTCIAAEETVLPSMDTTPCRGAIYLTKTTVLLPKTGEMRTLIHCP